MDRSLKVAAKRHLQGLAMEIRPPSSCLGNLLPPREAFGRGGEAVAEVSIPKGDKTVQLSQVPVPGVHSSEGKRQRKADPGFEQIEPVPRTPKVLSAKSENVERSIAERQLVREDRPNRCLSALPHQQPVPGVPGVPLARQVLHFHSPSLRALRRPGSFPRTDKSPFGIVQGPGLPMPGLPGRPPGHCPEQGTVPEGSSVSSKSSGKIGLPHKPREVPALPLPAARMAGSFDRRKRPESKLASSQGLQDRRHGKLISGFQEDGQARLGVLPWPISFRQPNWPRTHLAQEASRPNPLATSFKGRLHPPTLGNFASAGMVSNPREPIPMVPLPQPSTLGAPVDQRLRSRVGWTRPAWELGGWLLGPPRKFFTHEHSGAQSSLPLTSQQLDPGRKLCPSILGQFDDSSVPPQARLLQVPGNHQGGPGHFSPVRGKESCHSPSQNSGKAECPSGCTLQKHCPPRGVGAPSPGQIKNPVSLPGIAGGPDSNPLECHPEEVCLPIPSPGGGSHGRVDGGLEEVGAHLSVPPSFPSPQGLGEPPPVPGDNDSHPEGPPLPGYPSGSATSSNQGFQPTLAPATEGEGSVADRWQTQVLSLDCVSLLRAHLTPKLGSGLTERLINSKRQSTLYQQQVAWRAFQDFITRLSNDESPEWVDLRSKPLGPAHVLHFCVWLRTTKNFESQTIANYLASVAFYLDQVFRVDCSSWEFKALKQHLFLDRPPRTLRVPQWDLQLVLDLLKSDKYSLHPSKFLLAKKTAFLLALATGNRVSELSAIVRNGIGDI